MLAVFLVCLAIGAARAPAFARRHGAARALARPRRRGHRARRDACRSGTSSRASSPSRASTSTSWAGPRGVPRARRARDPRAAHALDGHRRSPCSSRASPARADVAARVGTPDRRRTPWAPSPARIVTGYLLLPALGSQRALVAVAAAFAAGRRSPPRAASGVTGRGRARSRRSPPRRGPRARGAPPAVGHGPPHERRERLLRHGAAPRAHRVRARGRARRRHHRRAPRPASRPCTRTANSRATTAPR